MDATQQSTTAVGQAQPHQIETIRQNIDSLVSAVLSSSDANAQGTGGVSDDASRRAHQANAVRAFKQLMTEVQSKVSRAIHEVEQKLGPSYDFTDASLQDLVGISPDNGLNQLLGRTELGGKPCYKLRDFRSCLPSTVIVPRIRVGGQANATAQPHGDEGHVVFLQPTLRNVWVIQHAYVKLLNHKENFIKQYLSMADLGTGVSRKYARDHYEDLSLANLPSKSKLGNLLDVENSSYGGDDATGDMMMVLAFSVGGGEGVAYVEAVTGKAISVGDITSVDGSHLVLPATEASIRALYETYKSLREATSEQRRASKDKAFAATRPVDEVAELEQQFNFATGVEPSAGNTGRKRRRILEDED